MHGRAFHANAAPFRTFDTLPNVTLSYPAIFSSKMYHQVLHKPQLPEEPSITAAIFRRAGIVIMHVGDHVPAESS